jgi:hypothetical protein
MELQYMTQNGAKTDVLLTRNEAATIRQLHAAYARRLAIWAAILILQGNINEAIDHLYAAIVECQKLQ